MNEEKPLPSGWTWTKLGEVFRWGSGGTPTAGKFDYYDGDIPWVIIGDLNDGPITTTARKITQLGLENSSAKWVEEGSVLVAMYGSIGKLGVAAMPLTTNQAIAFTKTDPVEPKYLFYFLLGQRDALLAMGKGASQANISQTVLKEVDFPLAPLEEQKRIVTKIDTLFSELEAGILAIERVRAKVKSFRASLLQAATSGEFSAQWRAQNPVTETGAALLKRILEERRTSWEDNERVKRAAKAPTVKLIEDETWKENYTAPKAPDTSNLPELPESWCWASVEQLGEVQGGIQKQPKRVPRKNAFPYLRVANVFRDRLDLSHVETMELFNEELDNLRLKKNDLLIVEGNGSQSEVGRSALWNDSIPNCVHQNHIIRVRLTSSPNFANFHWNSVNGKNSIAAVVASTSGLYTLSIAKVKAVAIPLPPIAEQEWIVAEVEQRLSLVSEVEATLEASQKRAIALRQTILSRAFAGELVPQNPSDESAELLLEAIRLARLEAEIEAKKQPKPKKPRKMPNTTLTNQRPLLDVLNEAGGQLAPERLFQVANYSTETVDEFYAALRDEVAEKRIEQIRGTSGIVLRALVASQPAKSEAA